MRATKSEILGSFKVLCKLLGKEIGHKAGEYSLDHNAIYGGYVIVENLENGCESHPFGARRRTGSDMLSTLYFAIELLQKCKEQEESEE